MSTYQPDLSTRQIEHIGRKLAADRRKTVDSIQNDVYPATGLYARYGKRCLDIGLSAIALVVTFPVNLVIAVVTLVDLGRPLFFRQVRVGKDAERFTIVKFRNMTEERNEKGDLLPPEQRVTKWGKFVRRASLDELLNFWSIFKGDMSIIGPRPLPEVYLQRFSKRHMHRLDVRPGLECPPRHLGSSVWTWDEQLENDIWYVEHLSFKTDVIMAVNLVRFALDRKSAAARAVAKRGSFMGYDLNGKAINDADIPAEYIEWVKGLSDKETL
ncbi:sugar transferase [Senegalimassilia sp.]|uniref:sugar transferase n=1 Tax=Senegalimassilia sp. TaxID=1922200 RepID=UPI0028429636|nr:sugar transferase [Senegalimassilia sp.]MDR3886354.1 sugar transferase [Senegalimassilia sp.]